MSLILRESPKGRRVSLFIPCMVDIFYPEIGTSVVEVLEHLGLEVEYPTEQICCGQFAYNAGYWSDARRTVKRFLNSFSGAEVLVTPSVSCAAFVRLDSSNLLSDDRVLLNNATHLASITWEFSEFLVKGLGITNLNGTLLNPQKIAFHDACHGTRLPGIKSAGRVLVDSIKNAQVVDLDDSEQCCGFGGLFSVNMAAISGAILEKKLNQIENCSAQVLTSEVGCLAQINGGLDKRGATQRVMHVAEFLAKAIQGEKRGA